jgi:hypothetical protein
MGRRPGIPRRVFWVTMPQIVLDQAAVVATVGQGRAAPVPSHVQGDESTAVVQPLELIFELFGRLGPTGNHDDGLPRPRFHVMQPNVIAGRHLACSSPRLAHGYLLLLACCIHHTSDPAAQEAFWCYVVSDQ